MHAHTPRTVLAFFELDATPQRGLPGELAERLGGLTGLAGFVVAGVIVNLEKKHRAFVNHYSFHIIDPIFGHVTIKMSGHPPFPAQVI